MDIVSLIEAPEPSSWAAIVCIPARKRFSPVKNKTHDKHLKGFDNADKGCCLLLGTCPEGQTQDCLVHGVFEAEVWNDLQVVGGVKGVS